MCSGCTQEYNLHCPIILDEATNFFNKHGVSDFTFDTCRLWGRRCRAKLAVWGSSTDPLIGLYQEGTHNVVDIPDCKAHHPNISTAIELLKQGIAELNVEPYDEDQGTGELHYVQMAVTTYNTSVPYAERYRNGKVQVALVWNSRDKNSPSSKKLNALANFLWRYVSALIAMKNNLVDPINHLKSWNKGDPCTSKWRGVLCFDSVTADGYLHVQELYPVIEYEPVQEFSIKQILGLQHGKSYVHTVLERVANYLNIKSLLDLTCQTVADMIKGKTPEEIRKTFNIKNDFSADEEEEVRRENQWAFE
ncbi:unnamed protein product [Camellia sinensis]